MAVITSETSTQPLVNSSSRKKRNASMEGLRGFAALMVILSHVHNMSVDGGFFHEIQNPTLLAMSMKVGTFGVMLFFMISGFLIVQTLIAHASIQRFAINRILRIYPVFFLLQLVMFTLGPLAHYTWMGSLRHDPVQFAESFLANMLFIPGFFSTKIFPIAQKNAWSLSFEMVFYITACLFYYAFSLSKRNKVLGGVALAVSAAVAVASVLTHNYAWFFVNGVAVYFLLDTLNKKLPYQSWQRLNSLVFLIAAFGFFKIWLPASLAFGLLFFISVVREEGIVSDVLKTRVFQYLGMISYSLYLIHPFVFMPLRSVMHHLQHHLPNEYAALVIFGILGIGFSVACATVSYRLIEVKVTSILKNRFVPKQKLVYAKGA